VRAYRNEAKKVIKQKNLLIPGKNFKLVPNFLHDQIMYHQIKTSKMQADFYST
jgi:hypothetical protein